MYDIRGFYAKLGSTLFGMLTNLMRPEDETRRLDIMRNTNGNRGLIDQNGNPENRNGFGILLDTVGQRMDLLCTNQKARAILNHFNSLDSGKIY